MHRCARRPSASPPAAEVGRRLGPPSAATGAPGWRTSPGRRAASCRLGPLDDSTQLGPGAAEEDSPLVGAPNAGVYASGSATEGGVTKTFK
ncbi:MAG TPA: hypothetical protein VFS43_26230 [Polyangiaceae bacterium]|nr:hypothetical protein [Polyangiaceae bacterium]